MQLTVSLKGNSTNFDTTVTINGIWCRYPITINNKKVVYPTNLSAKYLQTDEETKEIYISTTEIEREIDTKIKNYIKENGLREFKHNLHDIIDKFVDAIVLELDKELDILLPNYEIYEITYTSKRKLKRW